MAAPGPARGAGQAGAAPAGGAGPTAPPRAPPGARPRVRALDCEMVGTGPGGKASVLARISVVGRRGTVLFDALVKPEVEVTDWRTPITGIDAAAFEDLQPDGGIGWRRGGGGCGGEGSAAPSSAVLPAMVLPLNEAMRQANALLDGAVVVGHDLRHDFKLLRRFHQKRVLLRDTAFCSLLKAGLDAPRPGLPSLRGLAGAWLGDASLHRGRAHDSVEDARAAMLLYRLIAPQWEEFSKRKFGEVPAEFMERRPRGRPGAGRGRKRRRSATGAPRPRAPRAPGRPEASGRPARESPARAGLSPGDPDPAPSGPAGRRRVAKRRRAAAPPGAAPPGAAPPGAAPPGAAPRRRAGRSARAPPRAGAGPARAA